MNKKNKRKRRCEKESWKEIIKGSTVLSRWKERGTCVLFTHSLLEYHFAKDRGDDHRHEDAEYHDH